MIPADWTKDEGLLRVVAAAYESLFQGRPRMGREWLMKNAASPDASWGKIYIGGSPGCFLASDGDSGQPRKGIQLQFGSGGIGRKRDVDLTRFYLDRAVGGAVWQNEVDDSILSQSGAERLAASIFTAGQPVSRVSDAAVRAAKADIAMAQLLFVETWS